MFYNKAAKQIEYVNLGVFFFDEIIPLFVLSIFYMNLVKMQIPEWKHKGYLSLIFYSICLATMGVCVFQCANDRWRTFLFYYRIEGDKVSNMLCVSVQQHF